LKDLEEFIFYFLKERDGLQRKQDLGALFLLVRVYHIVF